MYTSVYTFKHLYIIILAVYMDVLFVFQPSWGRERLHTSKVILSDNQT